MKSVEAWKLNPDNGQYEVRWYDYSHEMTIAELEQIDTDLILDAVIRGAVTPKASLGAWVSKHSDGTYWAWVKDEMVQVEPTEKALVCLWTERILRDRIFKAQLLLTELHRLEQLNPHWDVSKA